MRALHSGRPPDPPSGALPLLVLFWFALVATVLPCAECQHLTTQERLADSATKSTAAAQPPALPPLPLPRWLLDAPDDILWGQVPRPSRQPGPGVSAAVMAKPGAKVAVLRVLLPAGCSPLRATQPTATAEVWRASLADLDRLDRACTAGALSLNTARSVVRDVAIRCIPEPSATSCSDSVTKQWEAAAVAAASAQRIPLASYDHVLLDLPERGCDWSGRGYLGGNRVLVNNLGRMSLTERSEVLQHEMGHNYGALHPRVLPNLAAVGSAMPLATQAPLDRQRSALSYHGYDRAGPHCFLLPQLAVHLRLYRPPALGAPQLQPGRIVSKDVPPYFAARNAGLMIDPSRWAGSSYATWRVWVSYITTDGYTYPLDPSPTPWNNMVLVHLTNTKWTTGGHPEVYRIAALLEGESASVPQLALTIRYAGRRVQRSGSSASVQVCRYAPGGRPCGLAAARAAQAAPGRFQMRLPYAAGGALCLRACADPANCSLPPSLGYPAAYRPVYFADCEGEDGEDDQGEDGQGDDDQQGEDQQRRPGWGWQQGGARSLWTAVAYSDGYARFVNAATGLCLQVTAASRGDNLNPPGDPNLRPRLVLAPCSSTIDWDSPDQQYSGQLFGLRRGSVLDARGVRLVPANQHPQFGAVCVDACSTPTCLRGLPDDGGAAAATAYFCWKDGAQPGWLQETQVFAPFPSW